MALSLVYFNKVVEILETSPELKKTATGIFKQVLWAAGGTIAGGAVGGPFGALAGCVSGASLGYCTSEDYSSLVKVLKNLSEDEKYALQKSVQDLVGSVAIEDLIAFVQDEVKRQLLLKTVHTEANRVHGA